VGDDVRIRIDDEGPGVPEELREAIFNRFHSVRPEHEDFGRHSGLGLAIVKHALHRHGGRLEIDSAEGRGSTFTCHFPHERLLERRVAASA